MADGPKLSDQASDAKNASKFKFSTILAMNKSRKYPDECFLNLRINEPFIVDQEFLTLKATLLLWASPQQREFPVWANNSIQFK